MFASRKILCNLCNRCITRSMSGTSVLRLAAKRKIIDYPREEIVFKEREKSLIPDHLRKEYNLSSYQKFIKFLNGPTAPILPMGLILIGTHVWILFYLFGGEYDEDFEGAEYRPIFNEFHLAKLAITHFFGKLFQSPDENVEGTSNES